MSDTEYENALEDELRARHWQEFLDTQQPEPICQDCGMAHEPDDTERCIEGHGRDDIQVTIHGRYGKGPMPVEFRDAMAEMVKLVVEAVDRGELPKRRRRAPSSAPGEAE